MTKPNFVEIAVVLDRSGSMESVREDTIGGFNAFLSDQRSNVVGEVKLSLAQFDDIYEVVHNGKPLNEVPLLSKETYIPRGMTALFDAIGKTINTMGERLSKTPEEERPSLVIFVILTDGQENSSKEFTLNRVKELIKHQTKKYNWQFVFLGADQDAFQAQTLGVTASNTFTYDSVDTIGTYTTLSRGINSARGMMANCSDDGINAAAKLGDTMRESEASPPLPK